jgi:hypothetical protein
MLPSSVRFPWVMVAQTTLLVFLLSLAGNSPVVLCHDLSFLAIAVSVTVCVVDGVCFGGRLVIAISVDER